MDDFEALMDAIESKDLLAVQQLKNSILNLPERDFGDLILMHLCVATHIANTVSDKLEDMELEAVE